VARAKEAYERGLELYNQGKHPEAVQAFLEAYALKPAPGLLYAAALAASKANQLAQAQKLLKRYLAKPPNLAVHAEEINKVRELLAEVEQRLPGRVSIRTTPPGARVFIDLQTLGSVGKTPFRGPLLPGEHVILLDLEGYATERRVVNVKAGEEVKLDVTFSRNVGRLALRASVAGAELYIDGNAAGQVPATPLSLSSGDHRIEVRKAGYRSFQAEVKIPLGGQVELDATLAREGRASSGPRRSLRPYFWTAVALSGATLAVGGAMFGLAVQRRSQLESAGGEFSGRPAQLQSELHTFNRVGIAGLAVGGALAVTAVTLLILEPRRTETADAAPVAPRPARAEVIPLIAPGGAMGMLRIRF
jgi:hypothetical protein